MPPVPRIPAAPKSQLSSVSPSPGLTSALQCRRILRARLFTRLRLLHSRSELAGCKSGLVWKLQSGVTVQSVLNFPGHHATLTWLYIMHPAWGKSGGGCADLLLQSLLLWLPAPPSTLLSKSCAALPSTANPAFLCLCWHLPLPKVASPQSRCNEASRSIASQYPWGNTSTLPDPALGEAKMIHLQACCFINFFFLSAISNGAILRSKTFP